MRFVSLVAGLVATSLTSMAATIVTITLDAKVYTVDTVTTAATLVSDYAFSDIHGLAYHAGRNSYFIVSNNNLYEFSLGGQPVFRRSLEFVPDTMWDIAIDRAGVLWGLESVSSGPDRLWRFGFNSGSTLIGETLLHGQIDFGADGSLYLWHSDGNPVFDGLFVIRRQNAHNTKINPEGDPPNLSAFCTMDTFNASYGQEFNGGLHFVRLFTGQVAPIGGADRDYRGAAHGVAKKFPAVITLGTVNLGKVTMNTDGCLEDRDNDPLRVCKFIVPNINIPPIRFEVNINAPNNPAAYDLIYKAKMTTAGMFQLRVQGKQLSDGQFVTVDSANLSTTYTTEFLVNGDPTPYLSSSGNGVFRIEVQPIGPSGASNYCLDLDQFVLTTES